MFGIRSEHASKITSIKSNDYLPLLKVQLMLLKILILHLMEIAKHH